MKKFSMLILLMFIFLSSATIYSKDDSESDSGITEENSDTNGSDLVSNELEKKQVDDIPNKTKIKWHIKPQYDEAHSFREGLAAVCKNEKWGYIDYNGNLVIDYQFDATVGYFHEGLAIITNGKRYGYIDKSGKFAIKQNLFMYDGYGSDMYDFHEGRAAIYKNGKFGFIDKTGKIIVKSQYDYVHAFSEGLALVCFYKKDSDGDKERYGFIDLLGNVVVPIDLEKAKDFQEGLAYVESKTGKGYIDKTGKLIIKLDRLATDCYGFHEGLSAIQYYIEINSVASFKIGFIDKTGTLVIEPKFNYFYRSHINFDSSYIEDPKFSEGLAPMPDENGNFGYINKSGEYVIEPQFYSAHDFSEGVARVYKDKKHVLIDKKNNVLFADDAESGFWDFREGMAAVECNRKVGFIKNPFSVKIYKIGDRGPAGGWVFYDKGRYSDGWRYLEAAPVDQTNEEGAEWGCYGKSIPGAQGTAIGTGKSNTQAIVKSCGQTNIAAKLCSAYRGGGKSDWFLPSKDELDLMYSNLHVNGVGVFADSLYWSSFEDDDNHAWPQDFNRGYRNALYPHKNDALCVRAVRAF